MVEKCQLTRPSLACVRACVCGVLVQLGDGANKTSTRQQAEGGDLPLRCCL